MPYTNTSQVLRQSDKFAKMLLGDEYLVIDSYPYKLKCDSNFREATDPFRTRAYVSSSTADLTDLVLTQPQSEKLSSIDAASFINLNAAQAGLHFKIYIYTHSIDCMLTHLRRGILDSLNELHHLQTSPNVVRMEKPESVHYSIVFPLGLNTTEIRQRIFAAGFLPGVTGADISRQYLYRDEAFFASWKTQKSAK